MATMLDAGVALVSALRQSFPGKFQTAANKMYTLLDTGSTFNDAMRQQPVFCQFECSMVMVGERSGRLPEIFRLLAEWYEQRHRMRQKIILGITYPLLVYHFAGLMLGVINVATKASTLTNAIVVLAIWTLAPWIAYYIYAMLAPTIRKSNFLGSIVNAIPLFGALQHKLETAYFYKALGICLNAGIGVAPSIKLAANSCINEGYKKHYLDMANKITEEKCAISSAFFSMMTSREKKSPILQLLQTGELTGSLPESCAKIANISNEEATRLMGLTAKVIPACAYAAIAIYLAFRIISFYAGYLQQINSLLE